MQEINNYNILDKISRYPRIYVDSNMELNCNIFLDNIKSHHIINVLRKKLDDYVKIFNQNNGEFLAKIIRITKSSVLLELIEQLENTYQAKNISVIFSPIKQHRMSFLIEKTCELGASDLYPVICEYTNNKNFNVQKANLTAIDAAQQSERLSIPNIYNLQSLENLTSNWPKDKIILFMEARYRSAPIYEFLKSNKNNDYTILIGPEGGFSTRENQYLRSFDFIKPINLGSMILRSETAIIASLAILQNF